MARIYNIGFELNSVSNGMEANPIIWNINSGSPSVQSTVKRSGTYAMKVASSGLGDYVYLTLSANSKQHLRFYLRIETATNQDCQIGVITDNTGASIGSIYLTSSNTLKLMYNNGGTMTLIGSASSALSANTWYRVELKVDDSGGSSSTIVEGKLDGTTFATRTGSVTLGNGVSGGFGVWGMDPVNTLSSTGTIYFDDVAINDGSGSNQNGYPGDGKLVLALPNAAGDNNPTAGDYSMINEIPPSNTATPGSTIIELDTTTSIGDFNVTSSSNLGIGASDTITLVGVLARVQEETAGTSNYALRIKSASGGTVSETSLFDAGDTTARTNPTGTGTTGHNPLMSYTDPTTGSAWTPTGTNSIDNMQIGVKTTDGSPDTWVLWMGAYIEYVPAAGGNITITPSVLTSIASLQSIQKINTKDVSGLGVIANLQTTTQQVVHLPAVFTVNASLVSSQLSISPVMLPAVLVANTSLIAPELSISSTVSPTVLSATASLQPPVSLVSKDVLALSAIASMQTTTRQITTQPSVLSVVASAISPQVSINATVTPAILVATTSVQTVEKMLTKAPAVLTINANLQSSDKLIIHSSNSLSALSSVIDPQVAVDGGLVVSPDTLTVLTSIPLPTITVTKDISVLSSLATVQDPEKSVTKIPDVMSLSSSLQASISGITNNPASLSVDASLVTPGVGITKSVSDLTAIALLQPVEKVVLKPVAELIALVSLQNPSLSTSLVMTPAVLTAIVSLIAPSVFADQTPSRSISLSIRKRGINIGIKRVVRDPSVVLESGEWNSIMYTWNSSTASWEGGTGSATDMRLGIRSLQPVLKSIKKL